MAQSGIRTPFHASEGRMTDEVGPARGRVLPERIRERFFAIVGTTVAELERALERFGPNRSGRVFAAYTDWEIQYELGTEGARVQLVATMTLPRWVPASSASVEMLAEWDRYIGALREHEDGHLSIARSAASRLLAALEERDLDEAGARTIASEVSKAARESERTYDLETGHGAKRGASLSK